MALQQKPSQRLSRFLHGLNGALHGHARRQSVCVSGAEDEVNCVEFGAEVGEVLFWGLGVGGEGLGGRAMLCLFPRGFGGDGWDWIEKWDSVGEYRSCGEDKGLGRGGRGYGKERDRKRLTSMRDAIGEIGFRAWVLVMSVERAWKTSGELRKS